MVSEDDVSDPSHIDFELVPRQVLHGPLELQTIRGRVTLGRPQPARLRADKLSDRHQAYAQQNSNLRTFTELLLDVNFRKVPREPIVNAVVQVSVNTDGADQDAAVIIEISPSRLTASETSSAKVAVKADLGVVKPEGEISRQRDTGKPFLYGVGVGTEVIQWEFNRVPAQDLVGSYPLKLVVDAPRGVQCHASLALSTIIRTSRGGAIGYGAKMPDNLRFIPLPL
jgi:hypothetical protein